MDIKALSRKELQALCKSNGIPANKSNAFMMDALEKKRAPLSHINANKGPPPPPIKKTATTNHVNANDAPRKPPLYANNLLRKGKRDAPTEGDHEEKPPKLPRILVSSGPRPSSTDTNSQQRLGGAGAAAAPAKSVKTEAAMAMAPSLRPEQPPVSTTAQAKVDSGLKFAATVSLCGGMISAKDAKVERSSKCESRSSSTDSASSDVTTSSKGHIDDRIRSQINAALCSKAMKAVSEKVDSSSPRQHMEQQMNESFSFTADPPPSPVSLTPLRQIGEKLRNAGETLGNAAERLRKFWNRSDWAASSFGSPVQPHLT